MKKKQILAMGLSAVLACSSVAFAAETDKMETLTPAADASNTEAADTAVPVVQESFRTGSMATVSAIQKAEDKIASLLIKTEAGQEIQLNLAETTLAVNNETGERVALTDIKEGDKVFAYYSQVMTRSLPPQSACELILTNVGDKSPASLHEVGTVTKRDDGKTEILTADGSMIVRVDDKTAFAPLVTKNKVTVDDLTAGTRFLAWYDVVALSYPGQAYTEKVVILPAEPAAEVTEAAEATENAETRATDGEEAAELSIVVDGKTLDVKGEMQDGAAVVPVRAVAEALGCELTYEQKDGKEFVTVENEAREMVLEIGSDLYASTTKIEGAVGMTEPAKYGVAPYIVDGTTYAPADMFKSLVGFDVVTEETTVNFTTQK